MNCLIILALLVTYVSALPFSDECASGPSYWCRDLVTAKRCGAFQHCLSAVWMKQKGKAIDKSELCMYCETVIQEVRTLMDNKESVAKIQAILENGCAMIPEKSLATQCHSIVNNDLPELLSAISARLDPQLICSLVGLCKRVEDNVVYSSLVKPDLQKDVKFTQSPALGSKTLCDDCKKAVGDVKDIICSEQTQKMIEDYINNNFCAYLGSLAAECKDTMTGYVKKIFKMIRQEIDPDWICTMIGFCSKNGTTFLKDDLLKPIRTFVKAHSEETCLMCKTILTELQTLYRDPSVQKNVENLVKQQICHRLGSFKDACESLVHQYIPDLFELLINELDPEIRCKSLGLCPANQQSSESGQLTAPLQAILRQGLVLPQNAPTKPTHMSHAKASAECILCEFVIKELAELVSSNSSQHEIMEALDKVCSILPSTVRDECVSFVSEYGPAIIALLQTQLNPQQVCTSLGLCRTSVKVGTYVSLVKSPETCGICQTVIQYIDSLLEENATSEQIIKAVEKVCNFMPATYKIQCDNLIEKYGPTIILLLEQLVDPKDVCTYLGLCTKAVKPLTNTGNVPEKVVVAHKVQLLGEHKCTWGPSYWCDSLENAKECKAVQHCVKHVWSKKKEQ